MHTTKIRLADEREAWVIHNSDWSADAHVKWQTPSGEKGAALVPGEVLLALGHATAHKAITDRLISVLEQMAPPSAEASANGAPVPDVPTITTPEDARRLFGEPMYAPGGAPSNASAAAIEALKMQRPVVTVNVAEPLTGKPSPRPSSLSDWAENQERWVRNWTSMPAGRVAVAVTLDERTGLWTGNGRALFVSPGDARDAVDDLLRKQGLL